MLPWLFDPGFGIEDYSIFLSTLLLQPCLNLLWKYFCKKSVDFGIKALRLLQHDGMPSTVYNNPFSI